MHETEHTEQSEQSEQSVSDAATQQSDPAGAGGERRLLLWLGLFCVIAIGVALWRLVWPAQEGSVVPEVPARCSHWIALQAGNKAPATVCLTGKTSVDKERQLRRLLQRLEHRCKLPKHLPTVRHGQRLELTDKRWSVPCLLQVKPMRARRRVLLGLSLPLNRASAQEMAHIPGLSKRLAARIVAYRTKHGPFASVDGLVKVRGIGYSTLQKLRPYLKLK